MELIDCIIQIPPKIDKFIHDWPGLSCNEPFSAKLPNYTGIIAIGSGTSYNSVKVIEPLIRSRLGLKFETLKPADFLLSPDYYLNKEYLFLFVSQGGGSKLVYECLKVVNEFGCDTVALSEDGKSVIARESGYWIDMRSDCEPFLFRTAGYDMSAIVATFFALWVSGKKAELEGRWMADLQASKQRMADLIGYSQTWFEIHKDKFVDTQAYFFIGARELKSLADEASIKFMEMLPVMSQSLELEESIHGPQNAFTRDMVFFFLVNTAGDAIKARKISEFIKQEVGGHAYIISNQSDINDFYISEAKSVFSFLEYVTFFQVGAYILAKQKGRDLSKVVYPNLTNYIQKKFEG